MFSRPSCEYAASYMLRRYQQLTADDLQWPTLLPCDRLFAAATEPVLIVDAATLKIVEANPPAAIVLCSNRADLIGTPLLSVFEDESADLIEAGLAVTRTVGSAQAAALRARHGGPDLGARLSMFRAPPESYVLVRLSTNGAGAAQGGDRVHADTVAFEEIDGASGGFLMTDADYRIDYANRVFIEMVERRTTAAVCGSSLLRWLALTAADLSRFRLQLARRQAVSLLTTQLCALRYPRRVEVCAVAVPDGVDTCWGFSVCELPRIN